MTRLSPSTLRALELVRSGMSQAEAARQCGVNRAAVSRALKMRPGMIYATDDTINGIVRLNRQVGEQWIVDLWNPYDGSWQYEHATIAPDGLLNRLL